MHNSVGFDEDHIHLLKSRVDNLVINMCVHENHDNDDDHSSHEQQGIDVDDLKKCANCMKRGKKEELYMVLKHCLKH